MTLETRFEFGENWAKFLLSVDQEVIETAKSSLTSMLGVDDLKGKKILDIGSGSGLFSLAANMLGAEVVSLDYDQSSVSCTSELKKKHGNSDLDWTIHQGSVLDQEFMKSLGEFDGVYSWGVLHHTGNMELAISHTLNRVANDGWLFIAIYNDQGGASKRWLIKKKLYHRLPVAVRPFYVFMIAAAYETKYSLIRLIRLKNPLPNVAKKADGRGMKVWVDWVDWVGGMPFEVSTPDDIIKVARSSGFLLDKLKTVGSGWGCNEFVFHKDNTKAIDQGK